jgi:cytidylate kinase
MMKKLTLVINGRGGVGKDTLCEVAARHFRVRNVSSITPIKALAAQCGWMGEKTDAARRFLSDLKSLTAAYNDYPTRFITEEYRRFLTSEDEILFVHIREGSEIAKFVAATGGEARTLLVRAERRMGGHLYGNTSDDLVEEYPYDYYFSNDDTPEVAAERFLAFLRKILS